MSSGHCCMYYCFVTFRVYIDIEKKMSCPNRQLLAKKLRHFTDQNGPNGGPHENQF